MAQTKRQRKISSIDKITKAVKRKEQTKIKVSSRQEERQQKKDSNEIILVAMLVSLLLCAFVTYRIYNVQMQYENVYLVKLDEAQARVDEEKARTEELERYQLYMDTRQYIENIAREKLGLVYPDEIILKQADE